MQGRKRTRAERGLRWTLIGFVLVCLGWKLYAVLAAHPKLLPDSADYGVDVPYGPYVFRAFGTVSLVGTGPHHVLVRLPVVPVFVRALGRDARLVVFAQAVFGAACWGVLAWVLARRYFSSLVGLFVGTAVLVFSMTATVALWDDVVLAESLSISLLALLIAACVRAFEQPNSTRIAVAVGVGSIWVFTRDPNAYMLLVAAITLGFLALVRWLPRPVFMIAAAWAVFAVTVLAIQSTSQRWEALYDILGNRILTDRSATQEFARAGMPVTPQVLAMTHRTADQGFKTKPELAELRRWTRQDGRQTYLRYLVRHPDRTLLGPFRPSRPCPLRLPACLPITGELRWYTAPQWHSPFPGRFDDVLGQRSGVKQYLGAVSFCLLTGVFGLWRGRNRNYGWIIFLTVASLIFAVLGWNAESQEVVRHTIDMWIYVTLGVIISLGALADEVIRIHKSRLPESSSAH